MRFLLATSLAGLAFLMAFALTGAANARETMRPDRPVPVKSLRLLVDHYRSTTWMYQRAAHEPKAPTAFSERRSTDREYLQWAIDTWTRRAYQARRHAVARLEQRLDVRLPEAPAMRARLARRVTYARRLAIRLRKIYPGKVTTRFVQASAPSGAETLRLWQARSARAALEVARHGVAHPQLPGWLQSGFLCIHRYEGAWDSNTGNGYYGGLQMDLAFQRLYGGDFLARWGTADRWPVWAQLLAAGRAHQSGRGFGPWPNTARACGLL